MKYNLIIAGPCAVESEEQMIKAAETLKKLGISYLRGGAFKPRTDPGSFQGLKEKGISILERTKKEIDMKIVTELMDARDIHLFKNIDIIQIGARNMQNFPLLIEAGKTGKTILLKRGLAATIDEWIKSAGYIQKQGNNDIIMCARGIRTFETETRNTADIDAIPIIKQKTDFKIIFDPSHSSGKKELILPLAKAAIAAGADGLMIETHPFPEKALCDAKQQYNLDEFKEFLEEIDPYLY
ncbi:3-deoxy-7-phosphoheptulonate synthase [Candidatus Woesearchaeota archaeon]|nr:3-deoxy-7-phosphoheptulonate synthase [Candidatus Woesearchaeota archaeon]